MYWMGCLVTIAQSSGVTRFRNPSHHLFPLPLLTCLLVPSALLAQTPTSGPTPTATPSGLTVQDLVGDYDVAIEVEGQEMMTGEGRVSERDSGSISIVGSVLHPEGLPDPSLRLRGLLSASGSIAVSGVYDTDGDILSQATGTVVARRVGQDVRIAGTIAFSGVRSGSLGLTMAKQSSSTNGGGGGGGCAITMAAGEQRTDGSIAILLGALLLGLAGQVKPVFRARENRQVFPISSLDKAAGSNILNVQYGSRGTARTLGERAAGPDGYRDRLLCSLRVSRDFDRSYCEGSRPDEGCHLLPLQGQRGAALRSGQEPGQPVRAPRQR